MSDKTEQPAPEAPAPPPEAAAGVSEPLAPHAPLTPDELAELKDRAGKAEEYWDRLLRTTADFDNFRKRAARERQDAVRYANEGLLLKLLPVLENFEMALAAARKAPADAAKPMQAGVEMIAQQLRNVLAEAGVEEIDAAGKPFDPTVHEAVSHLESPGTPEGHVAQQIRKGYRWQGRLLRPASVVVAKAPESAPASPGKQ